MARKYWKQPISFSLSRDVIVALKRIEKAWSVSRTSVVESAILHLHAKLIKDGTLAALEPKP